MFKGFGYKPFLGTAWSISSAKEVSVGCLLVSRVNTDYHKTRMEGCDVGQKGIH